MSGGIQLSRDIRPPNWPWIAFRREVDRGALSFYYSDSNSRVPVRDISRFGDSKSDPNLETMTYGLFSTCQRELRERATKEGLANILFCTNRARTRVLTGYYHIRWSHKGPFVGYTPPGDDHWLAADRIRFVDPGFPLGALTGYLRGQRIDLRFRRFIYLDGETTKRLVNLLDDTKDCTVKYLEEVKRLERRNLKEYGFAYPNWKKKHGFDWGWALKYLGESQ